MLNFSQIFHGQTNLRLDVPMAHIRELMAHTQWAVCSLRGTSHIYAMAIAYGPSVHAYWHISCLWPTCPLTCG